MPMPSETSHKQRQSRSFLLEDRLDIEATSPDGRSKGERGRGEERLTRGFRATGRKGGEVLALNCRESRLDKCSTHSF